MRVCCCGPKEESCCPPVEKTDISKATLLVLGVLCIGGAPLAYFLGVGTIGVMAIGISGGFVVFCVTIATVIHACREKTIIDLPDFTPEQLQFYQACEEGDLEKVKELLKDKSVSILEQNTEEGYTPFQIACKKDQRDVIELLLTKKQIQKRVDDPDPEGRTSLHWACIHKNPNLVQKLMSDFNANENILDQYNKIPLDLIDNASKATLTPKKSPSKTGLR